MAGSFEAVPPSATFALRRCGCFAVVLCAAWFVAGARPAPAGIINVWRSHGPKGGTLPWGRPSPQPPDWASISLRRAGVRHAGACLGVQPAGPRWTWP